MIVNNLAQILNIHSAVDLKVVKVQLDQELSEELGSLEGELSKNIMTSDYNTMVQHMGYVESQRDRVTRFLLLVDNLLEHAKGDTFVLEGKATEHKRTQHTKGLTTGLNGWSTRLDHMVRSIDSRVNLLKKIMGIEGELSNATTYRRVA